MHHSYCFRFILLFALTTSRTLLLASQRQGVPLILHLSDAVSPGKLINVNGFGFTPGEALEIAIELSTNGNNAALPTPAALRPAIVQQDRNGNFMVAVMPASAVPGVYNVWVKNKDGWSSPKKMNAARPLFISEREAFKGLTVKVSGRNFDCREYGVIKTRPTTKIRLNNNSGGVFETLVTAVNPYCINFKINQHPPGKYFVEVSGDNGINWSRLENGQQLSIITEPPGGTASYDPLGLGISWASHFNWKNIRRVPVSDGSNDMTIVVQSITDAIGADKGGGVVYFPAGVYKLSGLRLHKNVVLVGASELKTTISYAGKEKDFITCTGDAIGQGHVGIANMSIVAPAGSTSRPDVFINLGQAAIWQGVKHIASRTAAEMFLSHLKITYDFTETKRDRRGLPVSSIGNERLYIADCNFKGFRMESHNYVSDYVTVKNNRFEYAQGVFIYTGNFLFLENNIITGHTEINREKHGFMLRANAYVYNNTVAHTGSEEDPLNENWNDGEALCNETPGGDHNFGSVLHAASNSMVAGTTAGLFRIPQVEIYNHRSVMIIHGRGLGQYRRITAIDIASQTMQLEKEWDEIPDSSSRFTLMEPNENTVYYRNSIIDNPKGIWLFGNSIDCLVAENTSIDSDGIFIFSCMYTNDTIPMYYFVPNYFNRITGNRIRGISRKSHRAGIGLNSTREGISKGSYFGVMEYANEIRNNAIDGVPDAIPLAGVTEAPAASGIFIYATVHSSLYDNKNAAGDATNHIIENNVLKNLSTGISLSRCIYGQAVAGNHFNQSTKRPVTDTTGSQNTVYLDSY